MLDVLHVLPTAQRRGAETFAMELHHRMVARGHRSRAVALEPGPSGGGLDVQVLADARFSLAGLRALRRAAAGAGVVVAHGSSTLLACGAGLAGLPVPFVYTNIGDPRYWAPSGFRKARVGLLLRRAAAVAAICDPARGILLDHFGLAADAVHVVPNGRSGERFAPVDAAGRATARAALGLPDGRAAGGDGRDLDVVAVVGALSPEKRVDVAIRAVAALPNAVLVVAGVGPERAALDALAAAEAPGRVVFLGATDRPATVFAAADALLLSSASEGVPGVLIEAGLAGLPVAATDVGWVAEVVVDGHTGVLAAPGDPEALGAALEAALHDRDRLGAAARRHCLEHFEIDHVVSRWEAVLSDVAETKSGKTPRKP